MAEFISDNSTQTTSVFSQGNLYTSKTNPNLRLSTSSGIYYPSINNVRIYTNSIDALTIDSNQIIYGNGAGLTNLTYNNLNGTPTNFQSDWTSTIINKPINFQSDWTSTIINKPTNFQADWNTTIINKPTLNFLPLTGGTVAGTVNTNILNCIDVGISTSLGARNLNIIGNDAVMRIWRNHATNATSFEFLWGPTTSVSSYVYHWDMYIGTTATGNGFFIRDRTGANNTRFVINGSGNVGIGTTATTYKLNVDGSLNASSINVNGTNINSIYASNVNLDLKQDILIPTNNLLGIGSNITLIDYNKIINIPYHSLLI